MTTLITHPLPVLAVGLALGSRAIPARLLLAGMLAACLPDFDVIAFKLGIAYHDAFGHRGFSHSLLFAALLGMFAALACRPLHSGPLKAGLWVALATASHSLLDAMTNGGLGVAWFWPWSDSRYFMPFHPIAVCRASSANADCWYCNRRRAGSGCHAWAWRSPGQACVPCCDAARTDETKKPRFGGALFWSAIDNQNR